MNKIHKKEPTAKGKNPYATNPAKGDPAARSVKGDDLRVKRKVRRGE